MSPRRNSRITTQKLKQNRLKTSNDRSITAVRRLISPESYDLLETITSNLEPELKNAARIFEVPTIGITIIGYTRYDKRHRYKGIPTKEISSNVESSSRTIEAKLGNLAIYGSGNKHKLSFSLESEELVEEVIAYEKEFANRGFPLKKDFNNPYNILRRHCSIALLNEDHLGHFQDENVLQRLASISFNDLGIDRSILLDPVI